MQTVKTIETEVGDEGQVTIPDEVRRLLGLEDGGTIRFVVEGDATVHLTRPEWTFASVRGSVPGVAGMSDDLDEEIEDAMGEAMAERYPWTVGR